MRSFEFARKIEDGKVVLDDLNREVLAYPNAQLPEYQTRYSAGADFFCAETVVIPSIWKQVMGSLGANLGGLFLKNGKLVDILPTLVHTGIKANMLEDEVLEIVNRSSGPKHGLVLANSVGIIDADYYNSKTNDGEIMFAFYNFKLHDVTIEVGDRIGQGMFKKVLRPIVGLRVKDVDRTGGIGSTDISSSEKEA